MSDKNLVLRTICVPADEMVSTAVNMIHKGYRLLQICKDSSNKDKRLLIFERREEVPTRTMGE